MADPRPFIPAGDSGQLTPGEAPGAVSAPAFAPEPAAGRVFATGRVIRSTDVTPAGRLRLDAIARYLQDVAEDDVADAGLDEPYGWLLRRATVLVRGYPAGGQAVRLRTFCSATGPRWAERTTTLSGPGQAGDLIQARAVWVAVTRGDGQTCDLGPGFHRIYGPAAGGRTVSARLSLPGPPAGQPGLAWPLRATDFDSAGHVNNSVHWAALEDVLAGTGWLPASADLEYNGPILPGHQPRLVTSADGEQVRAWLLDGSRRLASARLVPARQPAAQAAGAGPLAGAGPAQSP